MKSTFLRNFPAWLFGAAALCLPASGQSCSDPGVTWTINGTMPDGTTSAITGDLAPAGATTYANGTSGILARLNVCGKNPSFDATLNLGGAKGRWFHVNFAGFLGNAYTSSAPTFGNQTGLLNVSEIYKCKTPGAQCTLRMTSALTGSDGLTYHLRMENPNAQYAPTSWTFDSTANCPYMTSLVNAVYQPVNGKDAWDVTPIPQSPVTAGCSNSPAPLVSSASVGVLIQGTTGNTQNFGQYNLPFSFHIQAQ